MNSIRPANHHRVRAVGERRRSAAQSIIRAPQDRIAAQLAAAGYTLPGTLTVRAYACGKPNCRCHADPPRLHGPYAEWTRKTGGKTITRRLSPAELAEYQPLFDNAKKLRALLSELQDLTLEIIEADSPRQQHSPEPEPHAPENVGEPRLTCGRPSSQTPFPQVSPKRKDLTLSDLGLYPFRDLSCGPFPGHGCSTVARQSGPSRWDRANLLARGPRLARLV